jgi:hypothetical protein
LSYSRRRRDEYFRLLFFAAEDPLLTGCALCATSPAIALVTMHFSPTWKEERRPNPAGMRRGPWIEVAPSSAICRYEASLKALADMLKAENLNGTF